MGKNVRSAPKIVFVLLFWGANGAISDTENTSSQNKQMKSATNATKEEATSSGLAVSEHYSQDGATPFQSISTYYFKIYLF